MGAPPRVRLLGPVAAIARGIARPLASGRQRALLALLAIEAGQTVTRTRLADRMWGEDLPADPQGALRTQISRLRRTLEPIGIAIETADVGYRLVLDPDDVDLHRFERLVAGAEDDPAALSALDEALALWEGEPFADLEVDALEPLVVRLRELRLSARERRARLLLDRGQPDIADLEALLRQHPEREEARGLLMEALSISGRHTEALRIYQEWRRHLAEELGLLPSPTLAALEIAILDHRVGPARLPAGRPATAPPRPVTSIIGRESDLVDVGRALDQHRLVTLIGPGGVGKTRLALEVAQVRASAGDVAFCDLASIESGSEVADLVAAVIGVERRAGVDLRDAIAAHVDGRPMMLLLDNCEHVLDGAAVLVEHLLQRSSGPAVLATSRERLGVDGEALQPVAPLSVENPDDPGILLFVERARALDPGFDPDAGADDVRAICSRLDGLPLSIELAAAHLRSLGVIGLRQSLDAAEPVTLSGGRRSVARHHSLDALVAWSYDSLDAGEQQLFDTVAVFTGTFDVNAAAAVAEDERGLVQARLVRLVETSMLVAVPASTGPRYRLLQTLRDSGLRHLRASGRDRAARGRHARWAVAAAESAARQARAPSGQRAAEAFASLIEDLRAAHAWCVGHDRALAARLHVAAHPFAVWHGFDQCFGWAETTAVALATSTTSEHRAVFASAAIGACRKGDLRTAASLVTTASEGVVPPTLLPSPASARAEIALMEGRLDDAHREFLVASTAARQAEDPLEVAWNQGSASLALAYAERFDAALELAEAVRAEAEAAGSLAGRAFAEFVLGEAQSRTDPAAALAHLERATELAQRAGTSFVSGVAQVSLAGLLAGAGKTDTAAALQLYDQAITRWTGTGAWAPLRVTIRSLAQLLFRMGRLHEAAVLTPIASQGLPLFGSDRALVDRLRADLRATLGDDAYDHAARRLRDATADEAARWALEAIREAGASPNGR